MKSMPIAPAASRKRTTPSSSAPGHEVDVVVQDRRDDARRAVRGGGDDPAARRVLLVDRHRVEGDPLHRVGRRVALGAQLAGRRWRRGGGPSGRPAGCPRGTCRATTHACITRQISSSPARISSSVRQARSFSSIRAEIDRPVSRVEPQQFVAGAEGVLQDGVVELDPVRAHRVLVDDEAAADRVVRLLQQLGARGVVRATGSCRWRGRAAALRRCRTRSSSKDEGDLVRRRAACSRPVLLDPLHPVVGALDVHRARGVALQAEQHRLGGAVAVAGRAEGAVQLGADRRHCGRAGPRSCSRRANIRAARIGPTVWELDGPMPIENRSKTEMATGDSL